MRRNGDEVSTSTNSGARGRGPRRDADQTSDSNVLGQLSPSSLNTSCEPDATFCSCPSVPHENASHRVGVLAPIKSHKSLILPGNSYGSYKAVLWHIIFHVSLMSAEQILAEQVSSQSLVARSWLMYQICNTLRLNNLRLKAQR